MRRSERGFALTEFAVVVPVFLAMIYGTMYLAEISVFKLRAQEIARFGAWGFTQHPLSAYDDDRLRHLRSFTTAQGMVRTELYNYVDLDAAVSGGAGGAWGKIMNASYAPQLADLRNLTYEVVPVAAQAAWAQPLTSLGMALTLLGVGTSVQSAFNGVLARLHLNTAGYVSSRATVQLSLPTGGDDAALSKTLARAGKVRGADLTRWAPTKRVRDGGKLIETTLLVDSWRVPEGFAAMPDGTSHKQFVNAVRQVSENGITALPGGPILSILLSTMYAVNHMPKELAQLFHRLDDKKEIQKKIALPAGRVMSRPYSENRDERANATGEAMPGQIGLFKKLSVEPPSETTVTNFETAPFFSDPKRLERNPYRELLKKRGPNFMGCPEPEKRGCWE